jgi:hypothetical protein
MSKPEFVTAHRLPPDALPRVKISPEAFQTLKRLRNHGETIREVVERLIFEAAGKS